MPKIFQIPAIVQKIETTDDKGARVKLLTRELQPEESGLLFGLHQHEVWVAMSEREIKPEDIEVREERVDKGDKTPAQRLRGVIYRLWEQTDRAVSSEQFYRERMESLITKLKEKLD